MPQYTSELTNGIGELTHSLDGLTAALRELTPAQDPAQLPEQGITLPRMCADVVPEIENMSVTQWPDTPVFGSIYCRRQIYSITVLDFLKKAPEHGAWDISEAQDGNVLAWVRRASVSVTPVAAVDVPDTLYHLYLTGCGGVTAPENCRMLFAGYTYLAELDLGTGLILAA